MEKNRIVRIRVPSKWYHPGDEVTMEHFRHETANFTLGIGPCGKDVIGLEGEFAEGCFHLAQFHSDGTSKIFSYPIALLTGRVEVETGEIGG